MTVKNSLWEVSIEFFPEMFNYFPGNHPIDVNLSSLKWCSLINADWCISRSGYCVNFRDTFGNGLFYMNSINLCPDFV